MTKILNYTLHDISIITDKGTITIPNHGHARCSATRKVMRYVDVEGARVPINKTLFGDVVGLPREEADTIIIVSAITANVMRGKRDDLYAVDVPVRTTDGKIVGCRALSKLTEYGN